MTNRFFSFFVIACSGIILQSCSPHLYLQDDETQRTVIRIDSVNVPEEDSTTLRTIEPYKKQLDEQMNEVIAYAEMPMRKNQPEGLLNNFVADIVLKTGNKYLNKIGQDTASVCLLNSGGLRSDLPKGSITVRNVFELMPFENETVAVTLSGLNAKKMFNFIAKKGGMPLSGAVMSISSDTAGILTIEGKPLDILKNYTVITSDYLALGGDDMTFFSAPVSMTPLSVKIRDLIIEYMKSETAKGKTISAKLDKRIYYEK